MIFNRILDVSRIIKTEIKFEKTWSMLWAFHILCYLKIWWCSRQKLIWSKAFFSKQYCFSYSISFLNNCFKSDIYAILIWTVLQICNYSLKEKVSKLTQTIVQFVCWLQLYKCKTAEKIDLVDVFFAFS